MRLPATFLVLALLSPLTLAAQSREETFAYLSEEIQSLSTKDFFVREATLSADGKVFTYRWAVRGGHERGMVINLDQVDIFKVLHRQPTGYAWYGLEIRTRGSNAIMNVNGTSYRGTKTLFKFIYDERQARGLEQAFQRLVELARGRKPAFPRSE